MSIYKFSLITQGEKFYPITEMIESKFNEFLNQSPSKSGILHLFCPHSSASILLTEGYDPSAVLDMQQYLKHLVPRNWPHYQHTAEGEDDSPSHIKNLLTGHSLQLMVEEGKIILGQWQAIFFAEFRDGTKNRTIYMKFMPDSF